MSWVVLRVAPDPARLGVVRMAVVSMARVDGLDECLIEDLRLATTEAAGRAIAAHRANDIDDPVTVELHITDRDVVVRVADSEPSGPGESYVELRDDDLTMQGPAVPRVPEQLAVVGGIADELEVRLGMDGTNVTMRWSREGHERRS
ncbi:MAG: ATP-binding protein [Nocardioidaceae bacterium]